MLSQRYIRVSEEFGEEECEVPLEDDGTLLLATLQSIFPRVTGLKFRNPLTNFYRAVKIDPELKFHPPGASETDGWDCDTINYICVFPKALVEAKAPEDWAETTPEKKATKPVVVEEKPTSSLPKTVDLIILNLSPQTAEIDLRNYFETKYGPLVMAELKRDRKTGSSRRFAFIRFEKYKDQMRALGKIPHKIDNQQVRVALPDYRDPSELYQENKCFIGRVNEAIKSNDLREFFSQFGEIVEVSYPKKFKGYAFVTFTDPEVAQRICGQDFVIKGYSVCVSKSTNGSSNKSQPQVPSMNLNQRYNSGYHNDYSGSWYPNDIWQPGAAPYVTAPLNPPLNGPRNNSNFYGQSAALSSMGNSLLSNNPINMLSMAMGNLLNNSMGSGTGGMQNVSESITANRLDFIFNIILAELSRTNTRHGTIVESPSEYERLEDQKEAKEIEEHEEQTKRRQQRCWRTS